jgi:acetoin utilization protein AcuB
MRLDDVMSRGVLKIAPWATADFAWEAMRSKNIHHLVVVEDSEVTGVISDRDLGGRRGPSVRAGKTVADLMTTRVLTATPATTLKRAAALMRGHAVGCLVVTDDRGRVAGIVTVADLLEAIGRGVLKPAPPTRRRPLSHRAPHRKRHTSMGVW